MSREPEITDDLIRYKELLSPEEFEGYQKMLKEIEENKEYYLSADPREMARSLINKCLIKKRDFYNIMKTNYSTEKFF